MSELYTSLAPIYDEIGMSSFARQFVPSMLDYAQRNDWLGRQILDLGCGTGTGILTLADSNFNLIGADQSDAMLEVAAASDDTVQWEKVDIRDLGDTFGRQDMVLASDVLNEMDNVRDLQAVFAGVHEMLREKRPFMFDMHTIAGLTQRGTVGDQLLYESADILVFARNTFDYERQTATRNHITFRKGADDTWTRLETVRVLRAFPIQAIISLLQRSGYSSVSILDTSLRPLSSQQTTDRVIFVANN